MLESSRSNRTRSHGCSGDNMVGIGGKFVPLYKDWCTSEKEKDGRKRYGTLIERAQGHAKIEAALAETMRSHYDRLERIAADVER
jgi:hypothetical protein